MEAEYLGFSDGILSIRVKGIGFDCPRCGQTKPMFSNSFLVDEQSGLGQLGAWRLDIQSHHSPSGMEYTTEPLCKDCLLDLLKRAIKRAEGE